MNILRLNNYSVGPSPAESLGWNGSMLGDRLMRVLAGSQGFVADYIVPLK